MPPSCCPLAHTPQSGENFGCEAETVPTCGDVYRRQTGCLPAVASHGHPMTADRWERLQTLFHSASELPAEERASFLERECDDDVGLRAEVERLLVETDVADRRIEGVIDAAAGDALGGIGRRDPSELLTKVRGALGPRYRVLNELGRGGSAIVFEAFDTKHEREVAIKVPRTSVKDVETRTRFEREIRLAAGLTHPHILPVYDSGDTDELLYYVMPLVEGESLADRILRTRAFELDEAAEITLAVLSALDYAHRHGIVHRDIKPGNILLHDGAAIVTDFGVGKAVRALLEEALTEAGALIGTPAYMSPEQAVGDSNIDGRADIYAAGCVLYEMLTGSPPFSGTTVESVVAQRLLKDAPLVTVLRPDLPQDVERVVATALSRDPDHRYATAGAFAAALTGAVASISVRSGSWPRGAAESVTTKARDRGIAVLPLVNRSASVENEYLSDGISEELIRLLSGIDGLRVVARTSAFAFKNRGEGPRTIASKLNVATVLEGSLQRTSDRLRIRMHLVDAATETDLWSERYDRQLDDIFAIEDDIAQSVVSALKHRLPTTGPLATPRSTGELISGRFQHPITDVRAFEYYLRARAEIFRFSAENLARAIEYLDKGLEIAGTANVYLQAALGYTYWQHCNIGVSADPMYLEQARACADRIFAVDADSPHGHRLVGLVAVHQGQPDEAIVHLRRALRHDPNDTDSLFWLSLLLGFEGRTDDVAALIERLIGIDPLTPLHQMLPGFLHLMRGQFVEACPPFRSALQMDAANPILCLGYGQVLLMAGRLDEADRELGGLESGEAPSFLAALGGFLADAVHGRRQEALRRVDDAFIGAAEHDLQYAWIMAQGYAALDERDEALAWLKRAMTAGFRNHGLLRKDPLLRNLWGDEGFQALTDEMESAAQQAFGSSSTS